MKTAYSVKGYLLDQETIRLEEPLPIESGDVKLVVEFIDSNGKKYSRKNMHGILKREIIIPDDFNEPLDCFREYML